MAKKPPSKKFRQPSKAAQIKAVKAKGYSASYEKRLIRGIQSGKSRQQARGHVAKEHVVRAERERETNEGLSTAEIKSIRAFYARYDPRGIREEPADVEAVIDFAREQGYKSFVEFRTTWTAARRTYLKELAAGTYSSRGLGYLEMLADASELGSEQSVQWLYYH